MLFSRISIHEILNRLVNIVVEKCQVILFYQQESAEEPNLVQKKGRKSFDHPALSSHLGSLIVILRA
jgi:hypothetical protein